MAKLDHVNIQTTRLAETVAFYVDVVGLEVRDPPELDPKLVQWMYDEGGRAILHLSTVGSLLGEDGMELGADTGAVHHVALDCEGHDAMVAKLDAKGARDVEFEGHSTNNMYRQGYRQGMVKVGDVITVNVVPMKDGTDGGFVRSATTKDGKFFGQQARAGVTAVDAQRAAEGR